MKVLRKSSVLAAMLLSGMTLAGGCVERSALTVGPVSQDPIKVDHAMELRPWSKTTALYENGDVPTYPTGFAYVPEEGDPSYAYYGSDTGVFFVNLVTMPYTLYKTPLTDRVVAHGVQVPESYTANPPQPGVAEDVSGIAPATAPTTQPVQTTP